MRDIAQTFIKCSHTRRCTQPIRLRRRSCTPCGLRPGEALLQESGTARPQSCCTEVGRYGLSFVGCLSAQLRPRRRLPVAKMPEHYLNTFRPLTATPQGRRAVANYGLPPFIDGSCRREPDLQSLFPSISTLCCAGKFAPRLWPGDRVAFLTSRGRYPTSDSPDGWRIVAMLRVRERFEDHEAASV